MKLNVPTVKRDGRVTMNGQTIGRVVREVDGWSPTEENGDYLGMTVYRRQSDAVIVLVRWWLNRR